MDNNETTTEKKGDKSTDSLKDDIVAKDNLIKDKEEIVSKLKSKIERLIEENNRIKQCAKNMDQEIKVLRSQLN